MKLSPVLTYHPLSDRVVAFSSTRHGGCSEGVYGTFNVNGYCGDDETAVKNNRRALCDMLGIDEEHLVIPHQTHEMEVRVIGEEFLSLPGNIRSMLLEGVDSVITAVPGVCIGVSTADCIPILLYDEELHVACAVHAGWRGTVKRIAEKAVKAMQSVYQARPENIKACIGPGISLDSFEVGDEVYQEFVSAGFDMERIARLQEKWHIDLPGCNRLQLMDAGVEARNIQVSDVCTFKNTGDYFSARKLGTASGRIFTGIKLL